MSSAAAKKWEERYSSTEYVYGTEEAYTPDQVGRGTGGPPTPELTMTLEALRDELVGLNIVTGREVVRSVIEGPGHTGEGAVVQVVATRI